MRNNVRKPPRIQNVKCNFNIYSTERQPATLARSVPTSLGKSQNPETGHVGSFRLLYVCLTIDVLENLTNRAEGRLF